MRGMNLREHRAIEILEMPKQVTLEDIIARLDAREPKTKLRMRQIGRKRCLTLGSINRRFAVNNAKVREERLEIFKVGFYFFGLPEPAGAALDENGRRAAKRSTVVGAGGCDKTRTGTLSTWAAARAVVVTSGAQLPGT